MDRRLASDAAIGLHEPFGIRANPDLSSLGTEHMAARALTEILLQQGLPACQQGRHRTRRADDDHVEEAVVAADLAARLGDRQHLAEVGDEDLGGFHGLTFAVERDLVGTVVETTRLASITLAS